MGISDRVCYGEKFGCSARAAHDVACAAHYAKAFSAACALQRFLELGFSPSKHIVTAWRRLPRSLREYTVARLVAIGVKVLVKA